MGANDAIVLADGGVAANRGAPPRRISSGRAARRPVNRIERLEMGVPRANRNYLYGANSLGKQDGDNAAFCRVFARFPFSLGAI